VKSRMEVAMTINYIKTQGSNFNISFVFDQGSVNELREQCGYTHLLEHCLLEMFRLEKDCTVQAYTEFDHVEFDFLFFKNNGDDIYINIFDNIKRVFTEEHIGETVLRQAKKEVLNEIKEFNPRKKMTSEFSEIISAGNVQKIPLGEKESIENASIETIERFKREFWNNCKILLVAVTEIDYESFISFIPDVIKEKCKQERIIDINIGNQIRYDHDKVFIKDMRQKLVCLYKYTISDIKGKLVQILSDKLIEDIILSEKQIEDIKISYKYITLSLKYIVIDIKFTEGYNSVFSILEFVEIVKRQLNHSRLEKTKSKIKFYFEQYQKNGITIQMFRLYSKQEFLYREPNIFNDFSYKKIKDIMDLITVENILEYLSIIEKTRVMSFIEEIENE